MKYYNKAVFQTVLIILVAFPLFADNETVQKETLVKEGGRSPFKLINERVPFDDIVTGGQPAYDQLKMAHDAGFKAVVNLRTDKERPSPARESLWVEELGMRYFPVPVNGATGISVENAKLLAEILSKQENYPLIVHCQSGNRVGALFALKAFSIEGKSAREALEIGKRAGLTSLEPVVQKLLKR
ncbi:MAG: sulfur transferase domain-containing protein [Candidatus Scalindua sp.]|nr:sulfur transferase domain-containing protein [Candidatus Scalindua sp.]